MKLFGSLENRLEEGQQFVKEIKVGDGVTEYFYSDCKPYEVTDVVDQKHIFIRSMNAKRTDGEGMSDCQSYEYSSDKNAPKIELVNRNGVWYEVKEYSKDLWLELAKRDIKGFKDIEVAYKYFKMMSGLTLKQQEKVEQGKIVKKYSKMNISIGVMKKYFDYSF